MFATIAKNFAPGRARSLGPIGLDIGARQVKAVQLGRSRDGSCCLRAAAAFPRSQVDGALGAAEAARITDVLFRRGFVGTHLALAVPDAKVLTANLELPPRAAEIPLDQIALAEFSRSLKVESDAIEFAYWDLPAPARAARATHVMGVGFRHADCTPIVDAFESAGFELATIDVEASALTRACFPMCAPPSEITAIVDVGFRAVRLFVVHHGVVSYQRSLAGEGFVRLGKIFADQFGAKDDDVIEQLTRRLSLRDDAKISDEIRRATRAHFDAVAAEIATSLSYTGHQYPDASVSRVLLCGGGAALPGLDAHLAAKLSVETIAVTCSDLLKLDDEQWRTDPSLTLAIGLAQWTDQD